jgi:hypothetical protein
MGGYDIFYSTRFDNGQWSKPINAGYPLNTSGDDLFFTPVRDGVFAYYAKYNKDDSYGMMDIYKLEVFTDLHPRKFILNGVSRVEGKVGSDFSAYMAVLINSKTGKKIDQTRLNPDGTYTLNATSGDLELQVNGPGIQNASEKFSIPIDNPSNVVSHTTLLIAAASETAPATVAAMTQTPVTGPEMTIGILSYNVTTNQSIPIRIDLEKDTKLTVENFVNGELKNSEIFQIKKKRFVYILTPKPGTNLLKFTLTDSKGNTTVREVTVVYTPPVQAVSENIPEVKNALAESDRYLGLAALAGGNLAKYLDSLNKAGTQFKSLADMYDFLVAHAAENGYTIAEVDELMARFLSQKDLNYFYDELKKAAGDSSLSKSLNDVDFKKSNIYTSEALLDYLLRNAKDNNYGNEALRDALYKIASANHDPKSLIELLESYSTGQLSEVLGVMKKNAGSYANTQAVADYLISSLAKNSFPAVELEEALKKAAADLDMNFLYQSLLFISGDSLRQTLLDLDLKKSEIVSSLQLITYLFNQSASGGYTKRELINNIEKIRKDPYFYVDMFRKLLAGKASGSLKVFLQEIDIRGLQINTYEELVDYLLNQSKFHDFNREMVYQLLLDIIDIKDVKEFVDLILKYCDDRIASALHATDVTQFSKPFEVVQYLLSVADDYHYTERDLMRLLLKMLLRKGSSGLSADNEEGWFASLDRPALVTSLVIVNSIIIIMLIVFLMRKKRKNDENGNTA